MRAAARGSVAVVEAPAKAQRARPPIDDELVFDFADVFDKPAPRRVELGWLKEAGGVKAAILRWLEEQV